MLQEEPQQVETFKEVVEGWAKEEEKQEEARLWNKMSLINYSKNLPKKVQL